MQKIRGNAIQKNRLNERMTEVINYVAGAASKTLGPYGHNVLIQSADKVISTKDGWTVIQNIMFDNILDNSLKSLIESCGQAVVLRVGDGTTTVTQASSVLNSLLMDIEADGHYTIREIETALTRCVNAIVKELRKNSIAIDDDNLEEAIYRIALVSTNWDKPLAKMISDIYVKTHNPIIKVQTSGTTDTTVDIINGFDLAGCLKAPNFYVTDYDNNTCEVGNPLIMMFEYNLQDKQFDPLYMIANAVLAASGRQLVVLAPSFDNAFISHLHTVNMNAAKQGTPYANFVPVVYNNNYNIDKECVEDFSVLCGASMITKNNEEIKQFFDDVNIAAHMKYTGDVEKDKALKAEKTAIVSAIPDYISNICGTCDKIIIGEKSILIDGLSNKNDKLLTERKNKLTAEIESKVKECDALTMLTDDIRQKRIRLGKLQCSMGVINIGGYGDSNLRARKDALEDATRACEAAYRDGYTVGSSIAIGRAIYNIMDAEDVSMLDDCIYGAIDTSFMSVFMKLFENKGCDLSDSTAVNIFDANGNLESTLSVSQLYKQCVTTGVGYDLIHETIDENNESIINPVNVDIEVLQGCLRLVISSITSDQFLFKNYEGFGIAYDDDSMIKKCIDAENITNGAGGVIQTTSVSTKAHSYDA